MPPTVREHLTAAAAGLLFISESEAPLEYVEAPLPAGGGVSAAVVAAAFGEAAPARETGVDDFFAGHISDSDPADPVAQENAPRFAALVEALEQHVRGPRVYCFGETEKRCYVVGAAEGHIIAGLRTVVYET